MTLLVVPTDIVGGLSTDEKGDLTALLSSLRKLDLGLERLVRRHFTIVLKKEESEIRWVFCV